MRTPEENQIVFVHGGVAQYRNGKFYTGMEDPRYCREIQWEVNWWFPINADPCARLLNVARGCQDYGGGHYGQSALAFHHGIDTVINALTAACRDDRGGLQVAVLERIGSQEI